MAEIGFFGLTIPEEYGGLGGDYLTYVLGMEELGRADSALRGIVSVSNGLVGKSILGFGTEEQKQEWLPGIATATKLGCFGLTEPDTGSDAGNLTAARRAGRHRLRDQRPEAVHHQRHLGRRGAGLRPHRRRRAEGRQRVPRPDRHPRLRGPRDQGQARAARPGHRRAVPRRRPGAGVGPARRGGAGLQDRDDHARQGPGLGGRGLRRDRAGLPGDVGRVRHHPHPVRPTARRLPAGAGADLRHVASTPTPRGCSSGAAPT